MENKVKLIKLYETHYSKIKDGSILTPAGEVYKYGSLYSYKTALNHLQGFRDIDLSKLDDKYIQDFTAYLVKKPLLKNTIGGILKCLFAVLNYHKRLLKNNLKYSQPKELPTIVVLSEAEITKMLALKLTGIVELVRDVFVLQANIGVRYSDLKRICEDGANQYLKEYCSREIISIRTQKSGKEISIPIRKQARRILNKYDYKKIQIPCNQSVNKYIKIIAKEAGIDNKIVLTRTRSGKLYDETKGKYQCITSHTARRSFATNAILNNVSTESIMLVTGHSTISAFRRYVGVTNIQNAIKLFSHPFFK